MAISTKSVARRPPAMGELFEAAVAFYHQLTAAAAAIHGRGHLSGPRRTVLSMLERTGPMTVSHLARARAQSRQRFQPLINSLLEDGLVEARPKPVHKQSPLIRLTPKGKRAVRQMSERERALRTELRPASSEQSLRRAAAVLRDVRTTLAEQLPALLREFR